MELIRDDFRPTPRSAKQPATIHRIDPARRFCHALDAHGIEYFIFCNAFQATDYRDITHVEIGTTVRGIPIENHGRWRLVDVEITQL